MGDSSSQRSSSSYRSSATARIRAKAEAARIRLDFTRKELEVIRQKAKAELQQTEFEAELRLLAEEKEAAAAEAEASYLEAEEMDRHSSRNSRRSSPLRHNRERTENYIQEMNSLRQAGQLAAVHPEGGQFQSPTLGQDHTASFLFKRELVWKNKISVFNEQPESFKVWKHDFQSAMLELNVSPAEELTILIKHLGTESRKYAESLQAANASNPKRGLTMLWERLEERYGAPELLESCLKTRLDKFPTISNREPRKLYELSDLLEEIQSAKHDPKLSPLFAVYDSSTGVNTTVAKLPHSLRQKWVAKASNYKMEQGVPFPPFCIFVDFVKTWARVENDPAFQFDLQPVTQNKNGPRQIFNRKTGVENTELCPIHNARHPLTACKSFAAKTFQEKKAFLREKNLCFKCLASSQHTAKECTASVQCEKCQKKHCTVMHRDGTLIGPVQSSSSPSPLSALPTAPEPSTRHGGEDQSVLTRCTALCKQKNASRSCGKIVKVYVFPENHPEQKTEVYAILDDQSNCSLATPFVMNKLATHQEEIDYKLTSCAGTCSMSGRLIQNLNVQAFESETTLKLPSVLECSKIPQDRSEIPTPDVAQHHPHLRSIAKHIPHLNQGTPIALLIGRDMPEAHHVLQQVVGPPMSPFAQRMPLGWVIVGDVCLNKMHKPSAVSTFKTHVMNSSRGSIFEPCPYDLRVSQTDQIGSTVFEKHPEDEKIGMSVDDRKFLTLMDQQFQKNEEDRWSAPLPLRSANAISTNNRSQAASRAHVLDATLRKDTVKREHFFKFMSKILDTGSAEEAGPPENDSNCWYLPLFGVYHPKKPEKIRGVFDSSATFKGQSLNKALLSGPDLTNSLVGILLRFRRDKYAFTLDIEQMFYQFFVDKPHRDLLRFFWYQDNDFNKPLVEYCMCVHVFGNSPSPAVATYGLRKTVAASEEDVQNFVNHDFYIDDGVKSLPKTDQAVSLIKRTQEDLKRVGKLRLHKLASNDRDILEAFPAEDLCPELQSLDVSDNSVPLPIHSCLGLPWNLETDTFQVCLQLNNNPFTHRGVLSTLNSIYDPHGFLAPAVITGKILLREICGNTNWDEPLPAASQKVWEQWKKSLETLSGLEVPRMIVPVSLSSTSDVEIHIFCDASEKGIAAVAYAKVMDGESTHVGFIMGKAKVAPSGGHTIPRLELCSAVLASELWKLVKDEIDLVPKSETFYTDSKVVLGYINNETRRFYTYVSNRVERIRQSSRPEQWQYVPTDLNPADAATRSATEDLSQKQDMWLHGPTEFLANSPNTATQAETESYSLISPDSDSEIRPSVCKTDVSALSSASTVASRFGKFSSWDALVRALCLLRHICHSFHSPTEQCRGWHQCQNHRSVESLQATEKFIIQTVQAETFAPEIDCLRKGNQLPRSSSIVSLSPYLDEDGLLRVGGRLTKAKESLGLSSVHPVILPKNHDVSVKLVQHYHHKVEHQGRHFTEGALRSAEFWVIGAKRLVTSMIQRCFTCKRLRGKRAHQQMANLPADRVHPSAPFSHVGIDVFGPWSVVTRKTRGGLSNSKRWAVIFTCMAIRAIHIEVLEEMSSSSFINALRRFIALRGPVTELRSDRGTNFVGAAGELQLDSFFVEHGPVREHLLKTGIAWKFNPPHASHMGGSWERLIGVIRRILDAMLLDKRRKPLTHEVLTTLMAEVCAIVNSRPIVPISHDPDFPQVLTPSMLLTMKCGQDTVSCGSTDMKETYKRQWKHVQVLSNTFWKHWKAEYLQSLQQRSKWQNQEADLKEGDLVLLHDSGAHRNDWPIALVIRTFPSDDVHVRTVELRVVRNGQPASFVRPVTELVPL